MRVRLDLYFRIFREAICDNAHDKFDDLDEEHNGHSKPETQNAADVGQQSFNVHHRLVLDDGRKVSPQHYVQVQKTLADRRLY